MLRIHPHTKQLTELSLKQREQLTAYNLFKSIVLPVTPPNSPSPASTGSAFTPVPDYESDSEPRKPRRVGTAKLEVVG